MMRAMRGNKVMRRSGAALCTVLLFFAASSAGFAADRNSADAAVANVLFDYDNSDEFASYVINEDGFVDIVFARNMPEKLYGEILTRLQNHPDIESVLAGKGGPVCRTW